MRKFSPTSKQFEDFAFKCALALVGFLVCVIVDGFDGVTSTRHHTYLLVDDPGGFRGALILRWGYLAILAAIGMFASGLGALVVRGAEKASLDQ